MKRIFKGSKVHIAVDTLSLLLAAHVKKLAEDAQAAPHHSVEAASVDQGYSGEEPKDDAKEAGIELIVVKFAEAEKGFVLLPRRWVVERRFAWTSRFVD